MSQNEISESAKALCYEMRQEMGGAILCDRVGVLARNAPKP